jgi:predicted aspartyl protease
MTKQILIKRPTPHQYAYLPLTVIVGPEGGERWKEVKALIDTGADTTVIRASVLDDLNVPLTGTKREFTGAGASGNVDSAWLTLGFVGSEIDGAAPTLRCRKEIGVSETLTEEMLLGIDVLGHFDLTFKRDGLVTMVWG